jgi:hypothetical protein
MAHQRDPAESRNKEIIYFFCPGESGMNQPGSHPGHENQQFFSQPSLSSAGVSCPGQRLFFLGGHGGLEAPQEFQKTGFYRKMVS